MQMSNSDNTITLKGTHSDGCKLKNGRGEGISMRTQDFTHEMTEMVENLSSSNLALRPKEIWTQVSVAMNSRSPLWRGLTDKSVIRMVGNLRAKANGGDIFRTLESPSMSMVKDSCFFPTVQRCDFRSRNKKNRKNCWLRESVFIWDFKRKGTDLYRWYFPYCS